MKGQRILILITIFTFKAIELIASQHYSPLPDSLKFEMIKQDSVDNNALPDSYPYFNISTGIITNKTFGTHGLLNLTLGIKKSNNYFNLVYEHRYGNSNSYYQIFDNDSLKRINLYNANYIGFEYQRLLIRNPKHKLYSTIGIGADWISLNKNHEIIEKNVLWGPASNIGLGYSYYIRKKHGPNIEILYHFADFKNSKGSKINPSSLLVRLSYNFGNDYRQK